jgi:hypothetical protein
VLDYKSTNILWKYFNCCKILQSINPCAIYGCSHHRQLKAIWFCSCWEESCGKTNIVTGLERVPVSFSVSTKWHTYFKSFPVTQSGNWKQQVVCSAAQLETAFRFFDVIERESCRGAYCLPVSQMTANATSFHFPL